MFRSTIFWQVNYILTDWLLDLSITDREIEKSPNNIVDLSISHLSSISLCLTYFNAVFAYTSKVNMPSLRTDPFIITNASSYP